MGWRLIRGREQSFSRCETTGGKQTTRRSSATTHALKSGVASRSGVTSRRTGSSKFPQRRKGGSSKFPQRRKGAKEEERTLCPTQCLFLCAFAPLREPLSYCLFK